MLDMERVGRFTQGNGRLRSGKGMITGTIAPNFGVLRQGTSDQFRSSLSAMHG